MRLHLLIIASLALALNNASAKQRRVEDLSTVTDALKNAKLLHVEGAIPSLKAGEDPVSLEVEVRDTPIMKKVLAAIESAKLKDSGLRLNRPHKTSSLLVLWCTLVDKDGNWVQFEIQGAGELCTNDGKLYVNTVSFYPELLKLLKSAAVENK